MKILYKLRFLGLILGVFTIAFGSKAWLMGMKLLGVSFIKGGIVITVLGIIIFRAIRQLKYEDRRLTLREIAGRESHLIREIEWADFDENEVPILRVYSNGTSALIFEVFPSENNKLTTWQIENFRNVLEEVATCCEVDSGM